MNKKSTFKRSLLLGLILVHFYDMSQANSLIEKEKEENRKAPPIEKCTIDLDVRECPIQLSEYVQQAQKLVSLLGYHDADGRKQSFREIQTETVSYESIIGVVNESINTSECVIGGIRIFQTLDLDAGRLKLYFAPAFASRPARSGDEYNFNFNYASGDLAEILINQYSPVYAVVEGGLKEITGDPTEVSLAVRRWGDYKSKIQFDRLIRIVDRNYRDDSDIMSVFFPLEQIKVLQASVNGQTNLIVSSAVKKYNFSFINTINLGNSIPIEGDYPRIRVPETEAEIDYYIGMAANMGQLCPTKCGQLSATKISESTYKLIN